MNRYDLIEDHNQIEEYEDEDIAEAAGRAFVAELFPAVEQARTVSDRSAGTNHMELIFPEKLLSKPEKLLLLALDSAIQDGNLENVQKMLENLNQNSLSPVMNALLNRLTARGINGSWDTGINSDGKEFVRLTMNVNTADILGRWQTVIVRSDGKNSAQVGEWGTSPWNENRRERVVTDPSDTFKQMMDWIARRMARRELG